MARVDVVVNGTRHTVDEDGNMPLLWALRDLLGLTGTKYGCGIGACGACTVLRDGAPVRACRVSLAAARGGSFTTIEGLPPADRDPVLRAWLEEDVSQCGYCQPGFIVRTKALLASNPRPTDEDIDEALVGHLCRCGSYPRIRRAIHRAAEALAAANGRGGR